MWWQDPIVLVAAIAIFVAIAVVLVWIFHKTQVSTNVDVTGLVGTRATVVTPIPQGGLGEIAYVVRGTRQNASALSADGTAIGSPAEVEIIRVMGSSFVVRLVEKPEEAETRGKPDTSGE